MDGVIQVKPDSGVNCCWLVYDKPNFETTGQKRTILDQDLISEYLNVTFDIKSMKIVTPPDNCHNISP